MVNCWGNFLFIINHIAYCMHIYMEFLSKIQTTTWTISFILNLFHSVCISKDCMIFVQQYSLKAVLGCVRLCSQASINPSSCFPAAKIPHILLYKEAFCLPFVSSDHHLIHSALVNNYSSTYSQLGILSYIFLSFLYQKYIYISTSLTFTYKRKTKRITHQVLGSTPPGYNFLNSGLIQLGYFNI